MSFQQVAILGLGFIGASLGLALRRSPEPPRVVGFDVDGGALRRSARAGAIDRSAGALAEVCRGSDVVVLAAPVRAILQLLPQIAPHLEADTLVTDTGSTKEEIMRVASAALPEHAQFVGGHPLTGPLTAGAGEASASAFSGAVYCLTISTTTAEWAGQGAVDLVEQTGAQPYWLDAAEHDSIMAAVSHLPHLASVALVNAVVTQSWWKEMSAMAAGGFRAASSLTDADPRLWADITSTNRENVLRQLDAYIERLRQMRELVSADENGLLREMERAQVARRDWLGRRSGAAPASPEKPPRPSGWTTLFHRG